MRRVHALLVTSARVPARMYHGLRVTMCVLEARWTKQDYLCKTKNLHAPAAGDSGRSGSPQSPRPLLSSAHS